MQRTRPLSAPELRMWSLSIQDFCQLFQRPKRDLAAHPDPNVHIVTPTPRFGWNETEYRNRDQKIFDFRRLRSYNFIKFTLMFSGANTYQVDFSELAKLDSLTYDDDTKAFGVIPWAYRVGAGNISIIGIIQVHNDFAWNTAWEVPWGVR